MTKPPDITKFTGSVAFPYSPAMPTVPPKVATAASAHASFPVLTTRATGSLTRALPSSLTGLSNTLVQAERDMGNISKFSFPRVPTYERLNLITKDGSEIGKPLEKNLQGVQAMVYKADRNMDAGNVESVIYKEVNINNKGNSKAAFREVLASSIVPALLENNNRDLLNNILLIDKHEVSRGKHNNGHFGTGEVSLVMVSEK